MALMDNIGGQYRWAAGFYRAGNLAANIDAMPGRLPDEIMRQRLIVTAKALPRAS
jgi:hypothetical protein